MILHVYTHARERVGARVSDYSLLALRGPHAVSVLSRSQTASHS